MQAHEAHLRALCIDGEEQLAPARLFADRLRAVQPVQLQNALQRPPSGNLDAQPGIDWRQFPPQVRRLTEHHAVAQAVVRNQRRKVRVAEHDEVHALHAVQQLPRVGEAVRSQDVHARRILPHQCAAVRLPQHARPAQTQWLRGAAVQNRIVPLFKIGHASQPPHSLLWKPTALPRMRMLSHSSRVKIIGA